MTSGHMKSAEVRYLKITGHPHRCRDIEISNSPSCCVAPLRPFIYGRRHRSPSLANHFQTSRYIGSREFMQLLHVLGPGAAPCLCVRRMHQALQPFLSRSQASSEAGWSHPFSTQDQPFYSSSKTVHRSYFILYSPCRILCSGAPQTSPDQVRRINRLAKLICNQLKA